MRGTTGAQLPKIMLAIVRKEMWHLQPCVAPHAAPRHGCVGAHQRIAAATHPNSCQTWNVAVATAMPGATEAQLPKIVVANDSQGMWQLQPYMHAEQLQKHHVGNCQPGYLAAAAMHGAVAAQLPENHVGCCQQRNLAAAAMCSATAAQRQVNHVGSCQPGTMAAVRSHA
jgi:hypothetical protein